MALFESYDRRIAQVNAALNAVGIKDIDEAKAICDEKGIDPYAMCESTQPICFENAKWAYVVGAAIAIKKNCKVAADAASAIGLGLQSFCIPGSVADDRKVGIGHGDLAARLLREETQSASLSWLVTNHSLLLKVLSRSLRWLTRFVRTSSALSSTVSARMLPRSSLVSMASHTFRLSSTTTLARLT